MRIATFNTELGRKGPGLLLRDLLREEDPQIRAVTALLRDARADILVLQGIDQDLHNTALNALADSLGELGLAYPHRFALPTNAGMASNLDLNGNGRVGEADDNHGYGRFSGAGAMAILSRYPVAAAEVADYTRYLWRDLPENKYPMVAGAPFAGAQVYETQRLSSKGHWVVPIDAPQGRIVLWTYHATPPVFDGPEDRNGRRNHDETAFWLERLKMHADMPFVIAGTANVDPARGDGDPAAIRQLLAHPRVTDPFPGTPTADFKDPTPGDLRVDYLLPSTDWRIVDKGTASDPLASRHTLLWIAVEPRAP